MIRLFEMQFGDWRADFFYTNNAKYQYQASGSLSVTKKK
jgi:hypothetical protein